MGNRPCGCALPLNTCATAFPDCDPGCQTHRSAPNCARKSSGRTKGRPAKTTATVRGCTRRTARKNSSCNPGKLGNARLRPSPESKPCSPTATTATSAWAAARRAAAQPEVSVELIANSA